MNVAIICGILGGLGFALLLSLAVVHKLVGQAEEIGKLRAELADARSDLDAAKGQQLERVKAEGDLAETLASINAGSDADLDGMLLNPGPGPKPQANTGPPGSTSPAPALGPEDLPDLPNP